MDRNEGLNVNLKQEETMGASKRLFTQHEIDVERVLVKRTFGCEIEELEDAIEREVLRMEFEEEDLECLKREKIKKTKRV